MKKDLFNVCLICLFVIAVGFFSNTIVAVADSECTGIIGSSKDPNDAAYYLQIILDIMKYGSIVLYLGFSIKDFFLAITNPDKEGLKKAWPAFFKRTICVILIFLLPMIITLLLSLFGEVSDPTCGLK